MAERTLFIVFLIGERDREAKIKRIKEAAASVSIAIESVSGGSFKSAFVSQDGVCFGFYFNSEAPMPKLSSIFKDACRSGDSFILHEVGSDFHSYGQTASGTWLQHHLISS